MEWVRKYFRLLFEVIIFLIILFLGYWELDIPYLSSIQKKTVKINIDSLKVPEFQLKSLIAVVVIIIGIFYFANRRYKNNLTKLETINTELQERIDTETKDLYSKFFELIDYKNSHNIKYSMEEYIKLEPFVMGVQIYTYSLKNRILFTTVRPQQIMELKINHLESVVAEQEDLNAIVQSYERINYWLFRDLEKTLKSNNEQEYKKFIEKYTKKLKKQIDKRQVDKISNNDVMMFNCIIIASERLFELLNENESLDLSLNKISLVGIPTERLYSYRRTGIVRLILNGEFSGSLSDNTYYAFRNRNYKADNYIHNSKEKRVYLGRTFIYNKKKHLILFTVNHEILKEENGQELLLGIEKKLSKILSDKNINLG